MTKKRYIMKIKIIILLKNNKWEIKELITYQEIKKEKKTCYQIEYVDEFNEIHLKEIKKEDIGELIEYKSKRIYEKMVILNKIDSLEEIELKENLYIEIQNLIEEERKDLELLKNIVCNRGKELNILN